MNNNFPEDVATEVTACADSGLLAGKVIVLIGAGPGFGRTFALRAASMGATVVLAARTLERVEEIADEVRASGGTAMAVRADAMDLNSLKNLRDRVAEECGRVDGLVNSAFSIPSMKPLAETDHAQILHGVDLSALGALRATQVFAEDLAATNGSVVMMASAVIHHSRVRYAGYKIAKTAMVATAESLATELGPQGIRVNTIAPGYIYGDTLKKYFSSLAEKYGGSIEDIYAHTAEKIDLHRLPTEREIADSVLFLLSPMASGVTGQTLTVDCGEFHKGS